LAAALLAQVSFLHYITVRGATLSPVLVVVVWYAIAAGAERAAIFGLVAGLCEDMLGTYTGGAWTVATTLTAIAAALLSRGFFGDSIPLVAGIVILATLLHKLIFWMMMQAQGYPPGLGWVHFHAALWQAVLNALLVAAVMLVLRYRENVALS